MMFVINLIFNATDNSKDFALNNSSHFPKLRSIIPHSITQNGEDFFYLEDPLKLTDKMIVVPQQYGLVLALCDGTRDYGMILSGIKFRTGESMQLQSLTELIDYLDSAALLENQKFETILEKSIQKFLSTPSRKMTQTPDVYPRDADQFNTLIKGFMEEFQASNTKIIPDAYPITGMISPHIDYQRGWKTYAHLWDKANDSIDDVEVVFILGTDHYGEFGKITPTIQNYSTPLGTINTNQEIANRLISKLGNNPEELHHATEHSIQLVVNWLHYFSRKKDFTLVPILCGSFHEFINSDKDPMDFTSFNILLNEISKSFETQKTLVIAAADLAHVGPAFGDVEPLDESSKLNLREQDLQTLQSIADCNPRKFVELSKNEEDSRRICGLTPIFLTLRCFENFRAEWFEYDQCTADQENQSVVSIAGSLIYSRNESQGSLN